MQSLIRQFKMETGLSQFDMKEMVKWAVTKGWPLPEPVSPLDRLVADFTAAAREEVRTDKKTGRPYRANHVYAAHQGGIQLHLWIDIDEAPRGPMLKAFQMRREQTVGDVVQLTLDADHWNDINPNDEPIIIQSDFGPDVEWRKNAPDERAG